MKTLFTCLLLLIALNVQSQDAMKDTLPYAEIPEAPENYTAGAVVSRMIDGLGFRYYWASEGLTEKDLAYTPGNDGRTIEQTLKHIYGLSAVIANASKKQPTDRTIETPEMNYEEIRKATLENFKIASELLLVAEDLGEHAIVFKRANGESEFPFWNNINGPIEDAVWHAGQVVVLRRSAGNPINSKVNVFLGKLND
jgi:uncharacterized damage-inducible protein DinB